MWSERRCSSACASAVSVRVFLPISTMNTGMSGRVQSNTRALIMSREATTIHSRTGTTAVETNAVRVLV